jgi:hypothetical protein
MAQNKTKNSFKNTEKEEKQEQEKKTSEKEKYEQPSIEATDVFLYCMKED